MVAYRQNIARYDTLQPGFVRPRHTMVTNYRYNSLNQVIQSYQPDYDSVSYIYYDLLSRPVLSQDGKQRPQHQYSYTVYDALGRIVEVGQIQNSTPVTRDEAATLNFITLFLNGGVKSEITRTRYDSMMVSSLNQTHLRNRIAAVSFCPDGDTLHPESATHYSYDIHGNVKRLVQDIPALSTYDRQFTALDYEYDLISGNVNRVWFQKGKPEQFGHRYRYDADNRITHVYTSDIFKKKGSAWLSQERLEARYFYLPHGALARVELGHKQIQGVDYAYTLQGWLKDINGYRSSQYDVFNEVGNFDIGGDGYPQAGNLNRLFAHDGFASSIQYYPNDYRPVAGGNYFNDPSGSAVALYNGNISALTTGYYHLMMPSLLKLFRYDKLNRIKRMQTAEHSYDATGWEPVSDNFSTEYTYDWNGNLLSLHRKDQTGTLMHHIRYNYMDTTKNHLSGISATGLNSGTYQYDALGNLVRDNAEGLMVSWNALGKVDTIRRNGNILSTFRYSPTGQRQVKATDSDTIYYIHDATGNVMCVYRLKNDTLTVMERYIYGSKRLGMLGQQVWITAGGAARLQDTCTIGHRTYELTDHLGNVTFTLPDRKWLTYNADNELIYVPNAVTYTDYYPFGFPMPRPGFTMGGYRYSFNGQEADDEVYGEGKSLSAEFWQYDTRLGRRWNVDPKFQSNISRYTCFVNNPISYVDTYGDTVRYKSGRERMDVFFARLFSKAFRKEFKELRESTKTYTYARMNKDNFYNSGGFISVDDATANHPVSQFTIHYSLLAKDFTGRSVMHSIFEETFHAVDYELNRSSSMIGFNQDYGLYTIGHDANDRSHEARAWQFAAVSAPFYRRRPLVRTTDGKMFYVYNTLISQIRALPDSTDVPKIEDLLYVQFRYYVRKMNQESKEPRVTNNYYE